MYYDCDALEEKVRTILELVGAREPVVQTNCGSAPANRIGVRIVLATPVPATQDNVRAATTFDSKDELVARVRKLALPTPANVARFPAEWQTRNVTFTRGDCDLVRGIQEQVLPKLAVRAVRKKRLSCSSRISHLRYTVRYEALVAVAPADAHGAAAL